MNLLKSKLYELEEELTIIERELSTKETNS
jgi:hypothetical protein